MVLEFGLAAAGFLTVLFLPGFALSLVILKSLHAIDRILFSFGLSIFITALVGFLFGGINFLVAFTGGITSFTLWVSLLSITLFFIVIYFLQK